MQIFGSIASDKVALNLPARRPRSDFFSKEIAKLRNTERLATRGNQPVRDFLLISFGTHSLRSLKRLRRPIRKKSLTDFQSPLDILCFASVSNGLQVACWG